MKRVLDISMEDFIHGTSRRDENIFKNELIIIEATGAQLHRFDLDLLPVRIEAHSLILVVRGKMTINIDYTNYVMRKNDIIELFSYNLLESVCFSPDFKSYHIVMSPDLYSGIFSQIDLHFEFIHVDDGRFRLMRSLEEEEMRLLVRQVERLQETMDKKKHGFYKDLVHIELARLLLEYGNIKMSRTIVAEKPYEYTYREEIVARFVQLLITHSKKESEVSFYSTELCITPEYLSRVMKSVGGKSVQVWIQQARIAESKILLRQPNLSVQQVAEELCFSDQSAFGKFFKKHTGKTPLEYRKEVISENAPLVDTDIELSGQPGCFSL